MSDPANLNDGERKRLIAALKESSAYRIAYEDIDFIRKEALRPVRLELELVKPELVLRDLNIRSTVVVFGSARTLPPDIAAAGLEKAEKSLAAKPGDPGLTLELTRARKQEDQSRYYDEARKFAELTSHFFRTEDRYDFVIVTGGGPGIMEAANRGAYDAGMMSAGLNITLPMEQEPNPYISPELCFQFHYFALRKMHFLLRARALVAFPGGYGTMDELFEALTLVQTGKMPRIPIVLVGAPFWTRVLNFDFLVEEGVISPDDIDLFTIVDTADQAATTIYDYYGGKPPA